MSSRSTTTDKTIAYARGALLALALAYLLVFLGCAALRLTFAWDLEWMEGGMLMHAARVLQGKPIYAPPSLDFVSFFYTPLYPYLLAGLAQLTGGLSFALGRGVSLVATLCTLGMLFYAGRREGGLYAGLLAAALYAALFRMCGTFFDLARADALSLALALGASLIAYYVPTWRGALIAAQLFVAAFFSKQTAALGAPVVGLYLLTVDRRRALTFGASGVALGLAIGVTLDRTSGGWFRFYTLSGHQGHLFYARNFLLEYWRDVLFLAPFLLLVPALGASYDRRLRWPVLAFLLLFAVAFIARARTLDYDPHMYYRELWYERARWPLLLPPLALAALLALARARCRASAPPHYFLGLYLAGALASDLNHSTQWAYSNCFMPIALFGSLYAALTITRVLGACEQDTRPKRNDASAPAVRDDERSEPAWSASSSRYAALALSAAMFVQLLALFYNPRKQVPSAADRAALASVVRTLDRYPAPVFIPAHPMYSYLRDGTVHVHQMGIGDVDFAGGVDDLDGRLTRGEFATVVEDSDCELEGLDRSYTKVHKFRYPRGALYSKTGFRVRPRAVWVHYANAGTR